MGHIARPFPIVALTRFPRMCGCIGAAPLLPLHHDGEGGRGWGRVARVALYEEEGGGRGSSHTAACAPTTSWHHTMAPLHKKRRCGGDGVLLALLRQHVRHSPIGFNIPEHNTKGLHWGGGHLDVCHLLLARPPETRDPQCYTP